VYSFFFTFLRVKKKDVNQVSPRNLCLLIIQEARSVKNLVVDGSHKPLTSAKYLHSFYVPQLLFKFYFHSPNAQWWPICIEKAIICIDRSVLSLKTIGCNFFLVLNFWEFFSVGILINLILIKMRRFRELSTEYNKKIEFRELTRWFIEITIDNKRIYCLQ